MDSARKDIAAGHRSFIAEKKVFMRPNLFAPGAFSRVKRKTIVQD
jgi:hypothetical protein